MRHVFCAGGKLFRVVNIYETKWLVWPYICQSVIQKDLGNQDFVIIVFVLRMTW